jgi:DNA modification methylase
VIECKTESSQCSHSAPYPRALVEFFIKAFSDPGDVVFDPFLGSGTTMAAAYGLGRSAFGCEISPAYTDVICKRIEKLSSQTFRLAGDGRTFTEMEPVRKSVPRGIVSA